MTGERHVDVLVVGAGPVGLYGAYCAGFRGLSTALVDSLPEPGGQVAALYPEKSIYDIAGYPEVRGRDLIQRLVEQASRFSPAYLLGQTAQTLSRRIDGRFQVITSAGITVVASAVIVTGGIGTFTPRPLPAGTDFEGRGLCYFVPVLAEHAGQDVIIVGGGDSAFDWALSLHPLARSVTLVHRRETFRAHRYTVQKVRDLGIPIVTSSTVSALRGDGRLREVDVTNVRSRELQTLPADAVVAALGFTADLGPLESWGVKIESRRILVDSRMSTTVPGVYAAGDITDYAGKIRLISVGFGEVATAVNNAAARIDPGADLFPGHSTELAM
ncbi:MAG TPA: NAD(P)/FAD-dependent oxidoreductase [Streptosporangiaceae bacterium]